MVYRFKIFARFPCLNDFIHEQNKSRYKGNQMKQEYQHIASVYIKKYLRGLRINKPVIINYLFVEQNKSRDKDNISGFAHKVIQDALVSCHVLQNDGWANIIGFSDSFAVDPKKPRIEVEIVEVENG